MSWQRDEDGKIITDKEFDKVCAECNSYCCEGRISIPCNAVKEDCPNYTKVDTMEYDKQIRDKAIEEFAELLEYEDLEKQGLLLRLHCKVGDFIYYPSSYHNVVIPVRVDEITISFTGIDNYSFQYNCYSFDGCGDVYDEYEFDNSDIGKTVFLTQSEAEEKLREFTKSQSR